MWRSGPRRDVSPEASSSLSARTAPCSSEAGGKAIYPRERIAGGCSGTRASPSVMSRRVPSARRKDGSSTGTSGTAIGTPRGRGDSSSAHGAAAVTSVDRQVALLLRHVPPLWDAFAREARFLPASPGGILLDVGCGEGSFLRRMGELGWRVVGLEPDPRAAAVARSSTGADVIEGPVEGTDLGRARFDAITMIHVIEHVRDPIAALRAVCTALKPGGTFAALTPNAEGRGHRVFGSAWFHLDPPRHLHLFRSRNLRSVAERAGLSVKRLWTSPLDALRVHHVSAALRARGRFDLRDMSWTPTLRDRAFRIA